MDLPASSKPSEIFVTINSCRGKIFQLYIIQDKTSIGIRDTLKRDHNFNILPKVFKTKIGKWGYTKHLKRSDVLEVLRDTTKLEEVGGSLSITLRQSPISLEKIDKYSRRAFPCHLRPELFSKSTQIASTVSPCIQQWRQPEKLLRDIDALIKGSFESGRWSFNGNDLIINSSPSQILEVQKLHDFLGDLASGCDAADIQDFTSAGVCWKRAFIGLEALVAGRYHDIIPNLIQKINDLYRQGRPDLADSLKRHTANCCRKFLSPDDSNFSIYSSLGDLDIGMFVDIEDRIMRRFSKLFALYLGPLCYNSFVMMIDAARRQLLQYPWTTFEDNLPAISYLDATFGPSDRRCLDVIGLRVEVSRQRGMLEETETEALLLIQRAELIQNDDWQRFYHLTRGWYFLGCAQYALKKRDAAVESLRNALHCEQELCKVDDYHIFTAEKVNMEKYLTELTNARSSSGGEQ